MNTPFQVFLLPGFDGTGELFTPLQSALDNDISTTVVRYQNEYMFEDYVDSVTSSLPPQNAVLIAESFSGPIAIALMARYPSRIKCAVLCTTFATSPFRLLTRAAQFVPRVFFGPNPTQSAILQTFCFDKNSPSDIVEKALSVIRSVPSHVIKSRLQVLSRLDMRPQLSQIKAPVLYLRAMQDRIVSVNLSQELIRGLPNVTEQIFDGPHLLLQSRANECAQTIIPFIKTNLSSE